METITQASRYAYAGVLLGALGRHEQAVAILSEGLEQYPDDPHLLRHRGHRLISTRNFPGALADLSQAGRLINGQPDEIEFYSNESLADVVNLVLDRPERVRQQPVLVTPESIEATKDLYKSNLHFNVWYHLALAQFLLGDFDAALGSNRLAGETAIDDDARSAVFDWRYLTLERLGRRSEAQALLAATDAAALHINQTSPMYSNRLRLYKGEITAEQLLELAGGRPLQLASMNYAIGNWHLHHDRPVEAKAAFDEVLKHGDKYSFAYIAAEADRDRLTRKDD